MTAPNPRQLSSRELLRRIGLEVDASTFQAELADTPSVDRDLADALQE